MELKFYALRALESCILGYSQHSFEKIIGGGKKIWMLIQLTREIKKNFCVKMLKKS